MMEEKLCQKWNEFQANVTSALGELKGDEDFTDVTLACEGGQFEVHRWILATCSPFFRGMLKNIKKHRHPLIYMRGVPVRGLEAVIDFIYQGEANILQGDLDAFLLIAEELQLKGLTGNNEENYEAQAQDPSIYSGTGTTKAPKNAMNVTKHEISNYTARENTDIGIIDSLENTITCRENLDWNVETILGFKLLVVTGYFSASAVWF